jgi:NADPH-dependent glutamate synthase beta subunit-like oxidoreductase/NAD-dependent dihydropyrimidine dehydrogenase PreA subunit
MALDGDHKVGAALVIGGGIAGIQAALDLAESGIKVYLVEKSSAIGGKMAQLDKTFPTNDCAMCIISPKLVECGRHLNIDVLTTSQVTAIRGQAGDFTVTVKRAPRYVDLAKCTACGDCERKCPISVPSEFNAGLSPRKAIFKAYPQAVPNAYAMDKRGMAPCRDACPTHQRAQGYIALIRERRFADAYRVIKEDNPFPSICGRVCNHKCEEACSRNLLEGPVSIMALKRFVADWMAKERESRGVEGQKSDNRKSQIANRKSSVAIVGSGPAGLTAAQDLALSGHRVTVFEALPVAGGMMRVGIPEYRLPAEVLQRDLDEILALGVELKLNSRVDNLDRLFADGYQAVFLAVGAHKGQKLNIPGESLPGVYQAVTFLRDMNLGQKVNLGRKVVVIGGGNTAVDAARSALRLGAESVTIVYRRSRAEMPVNPWEIEEAEKEGVKIEFLAAPIGILGEAAVTGVECVRMELGEPD